jgi:triosephosphate isomerase (TIM)
MRRKLVAGNWKMNGTRAEGEAVLSALRKAHPAPAADIIVCPPAPLIAPLASAGIPLGAQDCHPEAKGAHTGDVSAEMLRDAGASAVILGHSERRADHGESDALVNAKAHAAWRAGLLAIVCVGEAESERDGGRALEVVGAQLAGSVPDGATGDNLVVAYEPVWAIGTGRTPSLDQIREVHDLIRTSLAERFGRAAADGIRLLYGGSVKAANAADIFSVANVDGALVGGASLTAEGFAPIVSAAG